MRARHIEEQLATTEDAAEHLKAEAVRKLTAAWNKVGAVPVYGAATPSRGAFPDRRRSRPRSLRRRSC
jgi:hypothetical protein